MDKYLNLDILDARPIRRGVDQPIGRCRCQVEVEGKDNRDSSMLVKHIPEKALDSQMNPLVALT